MSLVEAMIVLFICLAFLMMTLCNRWLPVWFCKHFGYWHLAPVKQSFDGCSKTGTCPRCGKAVLQDSQGNWF